MTEDIKPDVLLTWPSGIDYPLCRLQLTKYRSWFNKIIISYYDHGTPDFIPFLRVNYPDWTWVESPQTSVSWRETAVLKGLEVSKSEYVLFLEQDFFWKKAQFLARTFSAAEKYGTVGIKQGTRLHPAYLLTRRYILDAGCLDFSAPGQDRDHFWGVSQDILALDSLAELKDLALFPGRDWYHFSSMTWNLFRIKDGNIREFHEIENFMIYNYLSRTNQVPQDSRWIAFTYYCESLLSTYGRFLRT